MSTQNYLVKLLWLSQDYQHDPADGRDIEQPSGVTVNPCPSCRFVPCNLNTHVGCNSV